jgi:hypothetical protein
MVWKGPWASSTFQGADESGRAGGSGLAASAPATDRARANARTDVGVGFKKDLLEAPASENDGTFYVAASAESNQELERC